MFGIICEMADGEDISQLKIDEKVTLRGVCAGYLMDVALNRCVQISYDEKDNSI